MFHSNSRSFAGVAKPLAVVDIHIASYNDTNSQIDAKLGLFFVNERVPESPAPGALYQFPIRTAPNFVCKIHNMRSAEFEHDNSAMFETEFRA